MTPEEMGAALGVGWAVKRVEMGPGEPPDHCWHRGDVSAGNYDGEWWAGDGGAHFVCRTGEAAVAVAHLLVAAERIAGGAEVGLHHPDEPVCMTTRRGVLCPLMPSWMRDDEDDDRLVLFPREARSFALDLLRAADEAEAQP